MSGDYRASSYLNVLLNTCYFRVHNGSLLLGAFVIHLLFFYCFSVVNFPHLMQRTLKKTTSW